MIEVKKLTELLRLTSEVSGWSVEELKSKWRKQEVVEARYAYFVVAKMQREHFSLATIGSVVNKDHSTVLHGLGEYAKAQEKPKQYQRLLYYVEKILGGVPDIEEALMYEIAEEDDLRRHLIETIRETKGEIGVLIHEIKEELHRDLQDGFVEKWRQSRILAIVNRYENQSDDESQS